MGAKLKALFGFKKTLDSQFFEDLEDLLIEGDFGAKNAMMISDEVKERKPQTQEEFLGIVKELLGDKVSGTELVPKKGKLNVYLILGVNGVGKTTSIGGFVQTSRRSRPSPSRRGLYRPSTEA